MTTLPDFIRPVTEGETVTEAPAVEKAGWGLMAEFDTPAQIMAAAQNGWIDGDRGLEAFRDTRAPTRARYELAESSLRWEMAKIVQRQRRSSRRKTQKATPKQRRWKT